MNRLELGESLERLLEQKKSWLVTGAAGFIGGHLCEQLILRGHSVIAVDNFSTGRRWIIDMLRHMSADNEVPFRFIESDIGDATQIEPLLGNVDFVLHQAAIGSVPRSIDAPLNTYKANVDGFVRLMDMVRRAGIKRFVYASSSSVFGTSETLPKVEGEEGEVISPYAASKRMDEIWAEGYAHAYDMACVGLRYFNVFGPRQDPKGPYAAVIPKWLEAMKNGEPCVINGDGETSRDFCYISNVVQANFLSALADIPVGAHRVNVACHDQITLNTLHDTMLGIFEKSKEHYRSTLKLEKQPEPVYAPFRAGDVRHSFANIDHIRNILGYEVLVSFQSGIKETIERYLDDEEISPS